MRHLIKKLSYAFTAMGTVLLAAPPSSAALLDLPSTPVEFAKTVQPNIFFMLDDSGSMDWSLMTTEGSGVMGLTFIQPDFDGDGIGCTYFYPHPHPNRGTNISPGGNIYSIGGDPDVDYRTMPSQEGLAALSAARNDNQWVNAGAWRAWNRDYNALYYDPAVTYSPWEGVDVNGITYADAPPTAAPYNPFNTAHGTLNLRSTFDYTSSISCNNFNQPRFIWTSQNFYPARYYDWEDTDEDGNVDANDGFTLVEIRPAGEGGSDTYVRPNSRTDCGLPSEGPVTCSFDQEIQNFANWFSYYRKRDLTTKKAVSAVIQPSTARIGLATIHDNQDVGTAVRDVDDISQPVDAVAENNKDTLFQQLFRVRATGNTPLRRGLQNVGTYFQSSAPGALGFSESSPILSLAEGGSCQQNFTILMTDGFWNGNAPNVGNADNDGVPSTPPGPFDRASYGDNFSNTLADVAMHYYERDLSNLPNDVPTIEVGEVPDLNDAQHMVTYTVAFGVNGTLDDNPPNRDDPFPWPQPTADARTTIDDLRHAAWNGRGLFLSARNPNQLITAMQDAIRNIEERVGYTAAVGVSSTSLTTDTLLFQSSFDSTRSSGDVKAYSFPNGTSITFEWSAASRLDQQSPDNRVIITYDHEPNLPTAVPFDWDNLGEAMKDDLRRNNDGTTANDTVAEARLAYLRGDRKCEIDDDNPPLTNCTFDTNQVGGITDADEMFRIRNSRLGDIVHSQPVIVAQPLTFQYPNNDPFGTPTKRYFDFETAQSNRMPVVYVGANDGMLHAFLAEDDAILGAAGSELFAYVPGAVYSSSAGKGLHRLTETNYAHEFYVDLTPSIDPAFILDEWRTVLVGGLRSGGQGYFAIDVTDPVSLSSVGGAASRVLWEFTDRDTRQGQVTNGDADLGYTFSKPVIGMVRVSGGNTTSAFKWVAIFGNGYNNSEADGSASTNGEAALFVVDLENGDLISKLRTGAGSAATPNGLASISAVDADQDAVIDYIYAGDLLGNLWKFNLTGSSGQWDVAYGGSPLYVAMDADGNRQPITTRPFVDAHPRGLEGVVVYFGTGQLLAQDDKRNLATQTFYAVWDKNFEDESDFFTFDRNDMLQQMLSPVTIPSTGDIGLINADTEITWRVDSDPLTTDYMGWYIDLSGFGQSGERVITDPVVIGDIVFFNSAIPDEDVCEFRGEGVLYNVDRNNGGNPDFPVVDFNNDGQFDQDDQVVVGQEKINIAGSKVEGTPTDNTFLGGGDQGIRLVGGVDGNNPALPSTDIRRLDLSRFSNRLSWKELEVSE